MGVSFEIYLTKKYVSKDEWRELIQKISNYNGILKKWKLLVINDNNKIRYFLKTQCSLPATISNLNSFLFKGIKKSFSFKANYTLLSLTKVDNSVIELINYS